MSRRAAELLRGLEQNALVCEVDEIEELLALGLAVEADPDDLATYRWLAPVVREFSRREVGDPAAPAALAEWLARTNKDLSSDWYRMTTSQAERTRREQDKVALQRALALLRDGPLVEALRKVALAEQEVAQGAGWVACPSLGVEQYALTHKGKRVLRSLGVRLERFANAPLKSFLRSFDKAATKMRAFGADVATLSHNIGYVRKNREHVIIGLAKAGMPAGHALGAYHAALREVRAPDVAVTCTRNAATFGSPSHAAHRLRLAEDALRRAGYPNTPIAMGSAKSLLGFHPPEAGVPRYTELMRRLEHLFGWSEMLFKYVVRLMPATGQPAEIVPRVASAQQLLQQIPPRIHRGADHRACAVALGAMAKALDAMPGLVQRYREIEAQLVHAGLTTTTHVEADALECMGCPGTPAEVVDTLAALLEQLTQGRRPERGDVAVAATFAKRFAY